MRGARPIGWWAAPALAAALAFVAPALGLIEPAVARGASHDLTLVTDATYAVHPTAGNVSVSVGIEARNHTSETRTRRYYFDHAYLALQPGAAGLHLVGPKGARVRVARSTKQATLVRVDFGSRLYSGRTASFRLTFTLPGRGRSASPQVRVGSSLVTIPIWAFASTGARGSSVTVRFPAGWDVSVESGSFARRQVTGDGTLLATGPLDRPLTFFAFVSAQRPAVFVETPLTVTLGDQPVSLVLRGWQDDPTWVARTGALFDRALPVLRGLIGVPWPMDAPLVVAEAVSRDADAYAGVFDAAGSRMDIAYWADHGVVIHQAAHGWFNGHLLGDRWANEGFATYYGLRAAARLKEPVDAPEMTKAAKAAALPLNAWAREDGSQTAADAYGYAASLQLATAVADAVGPDVLAQVWAAAGSGTGAYQPPPGTGGVGAPEAGTAAPETVAGVPDWRGLLDLLEDRSGTSLTDLWRTWVVTPQQATLLERRAAARKAYSATVAIARDWQLPRTVRDAMRAWQFDTATALMADARAVLAQRNATEAMARRDGVTLPGDMQAMFEAGALADASARGEAERAALTTLEAAAAARSGEDDPLSRIGMIGEHPDRDLAAARAAIARGDLETGAAASERAHRAWAVAWQEGRRRALLGVAVLLTIVILTGASIANLRRSRQPRTARSRSRDGGTATA